VDVWIVDLAGTGIIAFIVWYFFVSKREQSERASTGPGAQEIQVLVKGGYNPDVIVARPDVPLRIHFRREETSPCSEEVVFPDFGVHRHLPAFETTVIELPPAREGTYRFACGMDMMRGTLKVEAPRSS
jgi:plastocyanin domain-containing protein